MKKLLAAFLCLFALSAHGQVKISDLPQVSPALGTDLVPMSNTSRSTSSSYVLSVATISAYVLGLNGSGDTNLSRSAAGVLGVGTGAAGSTAGAIVANEVRSSSLVVTGSARVTNILTNAGVADQQVYIRDKIYGQYAGDGSTTRGAISFSAGGDGVQLEGAQGARIVGSATAALLQGYFGTTSVATFTIRPTAVDYGGGYIATGHTMVIAGGQGDSQTVGRPGGELRLTGGAAGGTGNNKGGDVTISGGAPSGTAVTGGVSVAATGGVVSFSKTVTAAATTGAQTIHKVTGAVNFAAAATSLVVTNNLVSTSSVVLCSVGTNDTTMKSVACVPTANTITITANAAATAETRVYFMVTN